MRHFKLKMHNVFGSRAPPGPAGGTYSAPPDLAGSKGREREGKGNEGMEGRKVKGGKTRGKGKVGEEGESGREGMTRLPVLQCWQLCNCHQIICSYR